MTTLADILRGIERGVFPAADLTTSLVPAPSARDTCVLGLTGHLVVAADVAGEWFAQHLDADDLAAPLNPPFLYALEQLTGREVNGIDALLLAPAITDPAERAPLTADLEPFTDESHPRIRRARRYRDQVRAFTDPRGGLVLTGLGVAGRQEVAIEIPESSRGRGLGRHLARTARALVPPGTHLWAQVTPGNAASLRTFLAAGYTPVGSEALLVR
ncbi:GCN5-related N-acetyltransferase [Kribbella flavida DSM 17836]|uniref:GCN5-related N-acetyltransferase n=1 Tax=Kribbella flavida (strain DSM 17836 / JCM 10339 / NBRC 14399) TaxID=479435 RepID=D2PRT9_KRIFD|nr:GCN5-related N-acetyltransferase [Kribbella flavida]ADB29269.1 GCN5-related N-acetyltransferase [Kribbella flavida DSM 17836]